MGNMLDRVRKFLRISEADIPPTFETNTDHYPYTGIYQTSHSRLLISSRPWNYTKIKTDTKRKRKYKISYIRLKH